MHDAQHSEHTKTTAFFLLGGVGGGKIFSNKNERKDTPEYNINTLKKGRLNIHLSQTRASIEQHICQRAMCIAHPYHPS